MDVVGLPSYVRRRPVAPVKGPVAPVKGPVAPVKGPVAPVKGPVAPVKGPVAPVKGPVAPVKGPVAPVKGPVAPVKGWSLPSKEDTLCQDQPNWWRLLSLVSKSVGGQHFSTPVRRFATKSGNRRRPCRRRPCRRRRCRRRPCRRRPCRRRRCRRQPSPATAVPQPSGCNRSVATANATRLDATETTHDARQRRSIGLSPGSVV